MVEYQKNNTFFAQGIYHHGQHCIPAQLYGSYKSHSPDPVTIVVFSENEDAPDIFDRSMRYPYSVWFDGKTEMDQPIWMMGIKPQQITGLKRLEGDVNIYIEGDLDAYAEADRQILIHAKISPTPLIIPEWTYSQNDDGTITRVGTDRERTGISWENEHGKALLIDFYEYMNLGQENQGTSVRIRTDSLFLTIIPHTKTALKAILFQLPKILHEDLNLLSFIGRRRIVCYEATGEIKHEETNHVAFSRYKTWRGFYNLPSDQSSLRSLIKPQALRDGVFHQLLLNYRASPYKAIIGRSIPYLITSYEDGYIETHLVNAFAALESMVDGIGEALNYSYLLGSSPFNKLSGKIKDIIHHEVEDPIISQGIIKKIPELRRRSYVDRLIYLLEQQGVNTNLIWPPNTDQPNELHELIKRRNLLIHTGTLDHGDICLFDLSRFQKLVELWILKLLDCPQEAINEYSLWRDAPINQIIHY